MRCTLHSAHKFRTTCAKKKSLGKCLGSFTVHTYSWLVHIPNCSPLVHSQARCDACIQRTHMTWDRNLPFRPGDSSAIDDSKKYGGQSFVRHRFLEIRYFNFKGYFSPIFYIEHTQTIAYIYTHKITNIHKKVKLGTYYIIMKNNF